jgi:hypothetical protein
MTIFGAVGLRSPGGDARDVRGLKRVILRVWGFTSVDVLRAEQMARRAPSAQNWAVVEVIPSRSAVCPIPSHDPVALTQGADYDQAWAVYPDWGPDR